MRGFDSGFIAGFGGSDLGGIVDINRGDGQHGLGQRFGHGGVAGGVFGDLCGDLRCHRVICEFGQFFQRFGVNASHFGDNLRRGVRHEGINDMLLDYLGDPFLGLALDFRDRNKDDFILDHDEDVAALDAGFLAPGAKPALFL